MVGGDIFPNFDPWSQNSGEIWVRNPVFSTTLARFTLVPNGAETIDVQPGDTWQGVYRFDSVKAPNGEAIVSKDPIRLGDGGAVNLTGPTGSGQFLELPYPVNGTDVTVTWHVSVPSITATNLVVKAGAILAHPATMRTSSEPDVDREWAARLNQAADRRIGSRIPVDDDVSGRDERSSLVGWKPHGREREQRERAGRFHVWERGEAAGGGGGAVVGGAGVAWCA
jgi:hypothetical protein